MCSGAPTSIWYGSPQNQIQAFRSFHINPVLAEAHGYPELTPVLKQKVFGLNGARVCGVDVPQRRRKTDADPIGTRKAAYRAAGEAEDTYMPSYPPMSPVTTSHFAMWSLFDVQFGQSRETIGTCFLRIAELAEMPVELRTTVATLQASRLGIHVHCGHEGRFVRLREIGTETAVLCLVPAGYRGDVGEVWLARLLPPATALFGYHVVATTPYIVRGGAEAQWLAYLERERQRVGSKIPMRRMDATSYIMKHGPSANHWNEYILCAYAGHCKEAVFLAGIPDIKESLSHA